MSKKKKNMKSAKSLGIDEDLYKVLKKKGDFKAIIQLLEESNKDFVGLLSEEDTLKEIVKTSNRVTEFYEDLVKKRTISEVGKEISVLGVKHRIGFSRTGLNIKLIEERIEKERLKREEVDK